MKLLPRLLATITGVLFLAGAPLLKAGNGNDTWTGGAGTANWADGLNWTGANPPPIAGDELFFGTAGGGGAVLNNNNIGAGTIYSNLTFNLGAPSFTLTGYSITFDGALYDYSANPQIINLNFGWGDATHSLNVSPGGALTVGGVISSSFGVNVNGGGAVTFTNNNLYTGTTAVTRGTLLLDFNAGGAANNILSSSSALSLGGGTLQVRGNPSPASSQTVNGTTLAFGASLVSVAPASGPTLPTLALGGFAYNAGGAVEFTGPAYNNAVTTTSGQAGSGLQAATATITTPSGVVNDALYSSATGVSGGTGNAAEATFATVGLYDFAIVTGTTPFTIAGASQGTGGSTGDGAYTLVNAANLPTTTTVPAPMIDALGNVSGHNSSYFAGIRFNAPGANLISSSSALSVGALLVTPNVGANNVTLSGSVGLQPGFRSGSNPGSTIFWQNNVNGFLSITGTGGLGNDGKTTGLNSSFVQAGQGTVNYTVADYYTGPTYLDGGVAYISTTAAGDAALGAAATAAAVNMNGGTIMAGATFALDSGGGANPRPLALGNNGGDLAAATGSTMTVDGVVSGSAPLTIGIPASSANNSTVGLVPGTGAGTANTTPVYATGTVVLSSGANSYSGGTVLDTGTLQFNTGSLGTGGVTFNGGTLQWGGSTTTDISSQTVTLNAAGGTIDVNGNTVTLANPIGNGGTGALTVVNSTPATGSLTLSGANTYTGGTTVTNGTLLVNNGSGSGTASGTVNVNLGGTLGGTGAISGTVNVNNGGIVAPGASGVGTLTVGSLTMNSGSTYNIGFSSTPANSQIVVTTSSGLTVNGGAFNLYQAGGTSPWTTAGTYNLIQFSGTAPSLDSTWTTASGANPHVANAQSGYLYSFGTSGGWLQVTITVGATIGTWNVDSDGNWSVAGNWTGAGSLPPHAAGDAATLGVGSAFRTVTLNAAETVGGISFTNPNSFAIANAGNTLTLDNKGADANLSVLAGTSNVIQSPVSLNGNLTVSVNANQLLAITNVIANGTGTSSITNSGAGTLVLSGNNTYGPAAGAVGTTLEGGTLQLGNNNALGAGDLSMTANSIIQAGTALSAANNISLNPGVTADVDNAGPNSLALGGVISGSGTLSKTSNGLLSLGGANTYSGGTLISNGIVSISTDGASAGNTGSLGVVPASVTVNNVVLNGGDLLGTGTLTLNTNRGVGIGSVGGSTPGTALIDAAGGATFTVNGIIASAGNSGANNLTVNSGAGDNGTVILAAANTFSGTTIIDAGTLTLDDSLALQNSTLNYNNQGGALSFDSLTNATLGGLSGAQNLSLQNGSAVAVTLTVGGNNASTAFSGALNGSGALAKIGSGALTLANPGYAGSTVVYNGGLTITGGSLDSHLDLSAQQGVVNAVVSGGTVTSPNGLYITSPTGGSGVSIYGALATLTVTNGAQLTASADANGRAISYGAAGNERPAGNGSLNIGTPGDTTTLVTANGALDMFASSGGGTVGNFAVNLNGGTLAVDNIQETTYSANQSGTFNFNGGILKALASDSTKLFVSGTPTQLTMPIQAGGAVINPNTFNITIGSLLTHGGGTPDGGLTVIGTGTLTVTNANQFTGGATIKGGTLVINGIYALGGANYGGLTISNAAILQYLANFTGNGSGDLTSIGTNGITLGPGGGVIDVNSNNVTYANSVGNGGSGGLTLQSTVPGGVLSLTASNNYAGNTTIGNGATLIVNNTYGSATGSGSVTVQNGGTLDGNGLISGNVTVQGGATLMGNSVIGGTLEIQSTGILSPGDGVGTNTARGLTLDAGAIADFEFNGTANDMTIVTNSGGLTVNGGVFNLYQAGGTLPWTTPGTYQLIQFSGSAPSLDSSWTTPSGANSHVANPQANFLYSFHASGGYMTVTIAVSGSVVAGIWTNDADGNWSAAANWSSNPNVPHSAGDLATFGTGSAKRTVTLDANESVGMITMNNNNSFVIADSGKTLTLNNGGAGANLYVTGGAANQITTAVALGDNLSASINSNKSLAISGNIANTSSAKTLTVNGAGTLALSGNNFYGPAAGSVGTTLEGGTVQVGSSTALGAGDISATGNGTIQAGANGLTLNNNLAMTAATTIDNNGNNLSWGGLISGTVNLVKIGNGTLTLLNDNNNYSGNTIVNGGILSIPSYAVIQYTPLIVLNGGEYLGTTANSAVYNNIGLGPMSDGIGGTGAIDAASGQVIQVQGSIDSAGNTGVNNLVINGTAGDNGTVQLYNQATAGDTYNGTTTISNGLLQVIQSLSLQDSTLNYNNQGGLLVFDPSTTAATLGGLSGAQNLGITNLGSGPVTLTVGNNNSTNLYSGNLIDAGLGGALTKSGSGAFTLAGTNNYAGATTISGGQLLLTTNAIVDTSAANITANGAQLVVNSGTLTATNASGVGTGTLLVSGGSATFLGSLDETFGSDNTPLIETTGGSLTAASLALGRYNTYQATQPTAGVTTAGLYVDGGTVNIIGNLDMSSSGSANSTVNARIDSGSLTVGGIITIGLNNGGRWSVLDVNGGTLTVTNSTTGINVGGPSVGNAEFLVRAGTATAGIIGLGSGTNADTVVLNQTGGSLYVGAGGIVQISTNATASITLNGGILGATANWSSTNNMALGAATIQAADASANPWNITLSGVLSGTSLAKTGNGTLTLAAADTYTGNTTISNGTLALASSGSIAASPQIGIGAGATFDVSALGSYAFSGAGPVQTLAGISTSGAGAVNDPGNTVTLASGAKALFQAAGGATPSVGKVSVTGNLALTGNAVTVNVGGATLGAGTYRLLDCTGSLSGTANATPAITGLGATPGAPVSIVTTAGAAGHVDLLVGKATPILQSATASSITLGQPLSASTLTVTFLNAASGVVPGTPVFNSPATMPPLGTASQPATFTPNDTTDYNTVGFNVNVTVVSSVLIPTIPAHITGFSIGNGNVVINGTNGQNGGTYYLLSSTDLALPLGQWTPVATNVVGTNGASGAFTFTGTNSVGASDAQQYYILSNTNN